MNLIGVVFYLIYIGEFNTSQSNLNPSELMVFPTFREVFWCG